MADLSIGYCGIRGAAEFDLTNTVIDTTNEDNIRCQCNVRPGAYDCDGAYMKGEIAWRIWKNNDAKCESAYDENVMEVVLSATEDAENLKLYIFNWADTDSKVRDVFVLFPLTYSCDLNLIEDVLFENALAQARSIRINTRCDKLREELLEAARENINIADTLKGLGYDVYEDETTDATDDDN